MATKKTAATAKTPVKARAAKTVPAKTTKAPQAKLKVKASAKDVATKRGDPYVSVVSVELDPDNVGNGAFELDWNDIFVARLVKAGYEGKDQAQIVDRWFQTICRNVLAENYEQWEANQTTERVIQRRDIGDGRTEVS
jgi:hypothetical protein